MSGRVRRSLRSCRPLVALAEYLHCLPAEVRHHVRDALTKADQDADEWPAVPYGYWMGRIKAYEEWLASLDETAREIEMRSAEHRTDRHYEKKLERTPLAFLRAIASQSEQKQRALLDAFDANRAALRRRRGWPALTRPVGRSHEPAPHRGWEHDR